MKKIYLLLTTLFVFSLASYQSLAQNNNLAAGDIAIVSYQSDTDTAGVFADRFSIVILRSGGIPAGTVLYITDNGWDGTAGNFIVNTEGFLKWVVPAGGISQGTEIYFMSFLNTVSGHLQDEWHAYTDEAGTTLSGVVTLESTGNDMALGTAGDQVLIYQTGPTTGPASTYNNATRRFITALHANIEAGITTYAAWDGSTVSGANQSSLPPGLTNGTNAFLMAPDLATELDNGKYNCTSSNGVACSTSALLSTIYTPANWTYSGTAFGNGITSSHCTYSLSTSPAIGTQPTAVTACAGLPVQFTAGATGPGTITYQWYESANATFTPATTLTNTGVYSGINTATLTIADNTGLGGKYYRAVATNSCGSVNSNGALLTVTAPTLPTSAATVTQVVGTNNNLYYSSSCTLTTRVVPGTVSGNVTSRVWVESGVPTSNGQPYVARHYEINAATNPLTATGTVTLYFTQAEFNAFNSAPGSLLDLPTGPSDATGIANLRVSKYPGTTSNNTGLPGTYSGGSPVEIDPADANIVWDAANSRWAVTFNVTGFSGFFVRTSAALLPVHLISFTGNVNADGSSTFRWTVAEQQDISEYILEQSTNGQVFNEAGKISANTSQAFTYVYINPLLTTGHNYYRLKIVGQDGSITYSHVIMLAPGKSQIVSVFPNPVKDHFVIQQYGDVIYKDVQLLDISGKILKVIKINSPQQVVNATGYSVGIYMLRFNDGSTYKLVKNQ